MKAITLLFFCIIISSGKSQNILTLEKAYSLLETENPDLLILKLESKLAERDLQNTKLSVIPEISIGSSYQKNFGLTFDQIAGELITDNKWTSIGSGDITIQFSVPQWMSAYDGIKLGEIALESKNLELLKLNKLLKLELLSQYFTVLANEELIKATHEQLLFSEKKASQLQEEYALGAKGTTDILLIEELLIQDQRNYENSKSEFKKALLQIKKILNITGTDTIILKATESDIQNSDLMNYPTLENESVEIRLLKNKLLISELSVKGQYIGYYPNLSFYVGYGTNYSSQRKNFMTGEFLPLWDQLGQNRLLHAGISLNFSIGGILRTRNNIRRAKINVEMGLQRLQQGILEVSRNYNLAINDFSIAQKNNQLAIRQIQVSEALFSNIEEQYTLGTLSAIDYHKAMMDYKLAQINAIKTKYTLLYAKEILKVFREIK